MAEEDRKNMMARKCDDIAEQLREIMGDGLVISEDTLFFAESTYGLGVEELESALTDPDFEDGEVILELIFFPDQRIRSAVEKHLVDSIFSSEHEKRIIKKLVRQQKSVRLMLPDAELSFNVFTSESLLGCLVEKLYICRSMDEQICAVLDQHVSPDRAQSARILLRCRGDRFSDTSQHFLCKLIEKGVDNHDFDKLFDLSLTLLAERTRQMSAEAYFLEQKRVWTDTLNNIRKFIRKRDQYSMEYLMMQRYQVPHESEEAVLSRLALLTIITDDVLSLQPKEEP